MESSRTGKAHSTAPIRLLCVAAFGALLVAQTPAQPGVTLRTTTALVQIHVDVRDSKGHAVPGLEKEDFEIFDNGKPQPISNFAAENAEPSTSAAPLAAFPGDTGPSTTEGGYAAILIDQFNSGFEPGARAWIATNSMLKKFDPGTKIAIYVLDGWDAKLVSDFGTDRAAMLSKVAKMGFRQPPPCYSKESCAREHALGTTAAFEFVADRLSFAPGRKALIWLSCAIGAPALGPQELDEKLPGQKESPAGSSALTPDASAQMERILRKMNNADIAIYPVDLSISLVMADNPRAALQKAYAKETGGVAHINEDKIDVVLRSVIEDARVSYSLSYYAPPDASSGDFHRIEVRTRRPGVTLGFKQGYSLGDKGASAAAAAGPVPGAERRAAALQRRLQMAALPVVRVLTAATIGASLRVPFFYSSPKTAVADLAMEISTGDLKIGDANATPPAELKLTAAAVRPDGVVAAEFNDTVQLGLAAASDADAFRKRPYRYEHQFRLAPGQYNVQVTFSLGEEGVGHAEAPLTIDEWDGKSLALSGVALAKETRPAAAPGLDLAALDGRKALVSRSVEIIPSGAARFRRTDSCVAYLEVYGAALAGPAPPALSLRMRVLAGATGEPKLDSGPVSLDALVRAGRQSVPVSLNVPVAGLEPGAYRLEIAARAGVSGEPVVRAVEFEVE